MQLYNVSEANETLTFPAEHSTSTSIHAYASINSGAMHQAALAFLNSKRLGHIEFAVTDDTYEHAQ